jgi:uncharacterized protein
VVPLARFIRLINCPSAVDISPGDDYGPRPMLERFAKRITAICTERPGLTVAVFAALFAIGVAGASRLEMRLNYLELLPEQDEAVQDLNWMAKKAGAEGYLITGITGGSREQRIAFASEWTDAQAKMTDVFRYAEFRYEVAFFRANAGSILPVENLVEMREDLEKRVKGAVDKQLDLGLDDEEEAAPSSGPTQEEEDELERSIATYEAQIPKELIEDDAKKEIFTFAKPAIEASNIGATQELLKRVRADIAARLEKPEHKGLVALVGGPMVFQEAFDNGVRGDLSKASVISLILASFFLLVATRRPVASFLIILPVAAAISVTLALTALFIGHLTIVSGMLVAVLLGLGVEFGIHLMLRTSEARAHKSVKDALLEAGPETMTGAFSGAVTNGAAFFVLVFCQFKAFREFGAIAACGVLLSWLFSYALLPPMLLLIERHRPGWALAPTTGNAKPIVIPRWLSLAVLVIFPLVCLYGALSIPKIEVERSFAALSGKHPDPVGVRAAEAMKTSLTPMVAWVPNLEEATKLERIYEDVRKKDDAPGGSILSTSMSLGRFVQDDWEARQTEMRRIQQLLKRIPGKTRERFAAKLKEVEAALGAPRAQLKDIPKTFTRKFTPLDGDGTFVLVPHSKPVDDAKNLDDFVVKIDEGLERARAEGLHVRVLSENRIAVRIFRQVFKDAPFIGWAATLVSLLTLFILLRSVRETLIVFTPIALGMLFMIAGMAAYGVKLNFINMAVIPSVFTVAIDNTIHLYHRYSEEGRAAMPMILRHTGAAVLIATCVNASGYSPMLLAHFYGLKSFGIIATLGMAGMLLATVVWFPLLLMRLPERRA